MRNGAGMLFVVRECVVRVWGSGYYRGYFWGIVYTVFRGFVCVLGLSWFVWELSFLWEGMTLV